MIAIVAVSSIYLPASVLAEEAAGDWLGVLKTPRAELHVGARLRKASDGSYTGDFASFDQSARNLKLSDVTASADSLAFTVPLVSSRYEARWDERRKAWVGSWTQGGTPLPLELTRGAFPVVPVVQGLDGDWDGTLEIGGQRLRLVFHVTTAAGEGTTASLDSVDQQANGIPITALSREGAQVKFDIKVIQGDFQGTLDAAGRTLTGTWTQAGNSGPLVLTRRGAAAG